MTNRVDMDDKMSKFKWKTLQGLLLNYGSFIYQGEDVCTEG